jgi:hypothetical protein
MIKINKKEKKKGKINTKIEKKENTKILGNIVRRDSGLSTTKKKKFKQHMVGRKKYN